MKVHFVWFSMCEAASYIGVLPYTEADARIGSPCPHTLSVMPPLSLACPYPKGENPDGTKPGIQATFVSKHHADHRDDSAHAARVDTSKFTFRGFIGIASIKDLRTSLHRVVSYSGIVLVNQPNFNTIPGYFSKKQNASVEFCDGITISEGI